METERNAHDVRIAENAAAIAGALHADPRYSDFYERRFFMIGVDEAIGYLEHEIVAPAIGTDEAAANAEHDPCGGRDCDECEIGGCDHGRPVGEEG